MGACNRRTHSHPLIRRYYVLDLNIDIGSGEHSPAQRGQFLMLMSVSENEVVVSSVLGKEGIDGRGISTGDHIAEEPPDKCFVLLWCSRHGVSVLSHYARDIPGGVGTGYTASTGQ